MIWESLPEHLYPGNSGTFNTVVWHAYRSASLRFLVILFCLSAAGYLAFIPQIQPVKGWNGGVPPGGPRADWMNPGMLALVRWGAVLLVVMHHAYGRLGNVTVQPFWPWVQNGPMFVGNTMFLALSGFLVARSLARNPSSLRFLVRRTLRLFPLLWLFTFGLILVLGPSLTEASWTEYFTSDGFRRLLATGWLAPDGYVRLPGLMKSGTVNPVLHIFPAFIYGYLLIWLFWKCRLLSPIGMVIVYLAFAVGVYLALTTDGWSIFHTRTLQLHAVVAGAFVGVFYEKFPGWAVPLGGAIILEGFAVWMGPYDFRSLYPATFACCLLFVAAGRASVQIPGIPVAGAYCFFLVHWPVQAVLQINFEPTDGMVYFLMTVVVVFGISAVVEGGILRRVEKVGDSLIGRFVSAKSPSANQARRP